MPTDEQVKFYSQFLDHATQSAISDIREHAVECQADVEVTTSMEPRIIAELFVVYDAISNLQKGPLIVDSAADRIFALVTHGRELPEAKEARRADAWPVRVRATRLRFLVPRKLPMTMNRVDGSGGLDVHTSIIDGKNA